MGRAAVSHPYVQFGKGTPKSFRDSVPFDDCFRHDSPLACTLHFEGPHGFRSEHGSYQLARLVFGKHPKERRNGFCCPGGIECNSIYMIGTAEEVIASAVPRCTLVLSKRLERKRKRL